MPTPSPTESSTSNVASFDDLARRFRQHHGRSIEAWLAAAETLLEARETLKHGRWGPFLEACAIGERTAQRMVRVARTGVKPDTVTGLGGITACLEYLPDLESLAELEDKLHVASVEIAQRDATLEELSERLAVMVEQADAGELEAFIALQADVRSQKGRINELLARINEAEGENKGLRKRLREVGVHVKL